MRKHCDIYQIKCKTNTFFLPSFTQPSFVPFSPASLIFKIYSSNSCMLLTLSPTNCLSLVRIMAQNLDQHGPNTTGVDHLLRDKHVMEQSSCKSNHTGARPYVNTSEHENTCYCCLKAAFLRDYRNQSSYGTEAAKRKKKRERSGWLISEEKKQTNKKCQVAQQ